MMGQTAHTPTPWAVNAQRPASIVDPTRRGFNGSYRIADAYFSAELADTPRFDEAKANAAFIVRAVNSFDALVAELDVRVGDLVMLRRAIEEGDPKAELLLRIDDMLRETRAALSTAEGRPE
jgi:hypothetical protein